MTIQPSPGVRRAASLSAMLACCGIAASAQPVRLNLPTPVPLRMIVTTVDMPTGLRLWPRSVNEGTDADRDDLAALQAAATKEGAVLPVASPFTVMASDGLQAITRTETEIPCISRPGGLHPRGLVQYIPLDNSLRVTPHVNTNGTITVDLQLHRMEIAGPAWRELSPPRTLSHCLHTKCTLRRGVTVLLASEYSTDRQRRLYFLTIANPARRKRSAP